jgi:hypothetical protein
MSRTVKVILIYQRHKLIDLMDLHIEKMRRCELYSINCWVLHPVACVSTNTLIKTTIRNKCFSCSIYCALLTTCFVPLYIYINILYFIPVFKC